MLTAKENELLTRVGAGTPCGELMRRYWHPVALTSELTEGRPKRRVRIMGEDLVLFRLPEGPETRGQEPGASQEQLPSPDPRLPTPVRYGLVAEQCSHRGASLYYGFLEDGGIRCPYHGWLYEASGRCLEQPFEPEQSMLKHTIRHQAYPVQELGGLLFTYMGPPEKQPLLPHWDVVAWQDGRRFVRRQQTLQCNWLQAEENTADVTHTYFLHGHMMKTRGRDDGAYYYYRAIEQFGFQPIKWGLAKSWHYADDGGHFGEERGGGNPLIFPNMLRLTSGPSHSIHWRVPVDDTTTEIFTMSFVGGGAEGGGRRGGFEDGRNAGILGPDGDYSLDTFPSQDTMAWETQGRVFDRTREHLGASDRGIAIFRNLLKAQIEAVQRGEDPMALVRDPEENDLIELPGWVVEGNPSVVETHGGPSAVVRSMDTVFDERHEVFEVPFGKARPR